MAIAAEILVRRDEQEEVLETFQRIRRETGWNIGFLEKELPEGWGWNRNSEQDGYYGSGQAPQAPKMKGGMMNPLLAKADFSLPNHPYQAFYQPPREPQVQVQSQLQDLGGGGGMGMSSGMSTANMGGGMNGGFGNGGFNGGGFDHGWGKYEG